MNERGVRNRNLARAGAHKRQARPAPGALHAVARLASRVVFWLFVRPRVVGVANVPRAGAVIVVGNHLSFFEPPLVTGLLPRRVTFLALYDLFDIRGLNWVLHLMGALPIKRGGTRDLDAVRTTLDLLKRGEAVGIYPEGTRSFTPGLLRANPGVSLLALRSGAPILPVAVTGTERLVKAPAFFFARLRGFRVRIAIGRPFTVSSQGTRHSHQAIADAILREVAALLPVAYRGAYGGDGSSAGHEQGIEIRYCEPSGDNRVSFDSV